MDRGNETAQGSKQVLFSIGAYGEKRTRTPRKKLTNSWLSPGESGTVPRVVARLETPPPPQTTTQRRSSLPRSSLAAAARASVDPVRKVTATGHAAQPRSRASLTIGSYGTEPRRPGRLRFLGTETPAPEATSPDIAVRLQSELVATLRRSRLMCDPPQPSTEADEEVPPDVPDVPDGSNVRRLATQLGKKLTFVARTESP